ncbi:MAG: hypothetical protein WA109_04195 [Bellilinea sp.]
MPVTQTDSHLTRGQVTENMTDNFQWLYDDVQQNKRAITSINSQLARRNYLRSLSAYYELVLSNLRETTIKLLVDEFNLSGKWKFHELYPLMDETARLTENGQVKLDLNRLPFLPLVAYTLKTYAKQVGFEREVLSDNRWEAFCETIKIRHRITHPKFHSEIEITDLELDIIDAGWKWWNDILKQLGDALYKKMVGG